MHDFTRFVWANGVTQFGTQITLVALPLTAVLTLNAGAFQLGLLTAAEMIAFLVIGLPAGVWVDRMRRRPILVWTDLIRGLALLTIPVAAWLGVLSLVQLYAVALVVGFCTVFYDVAHMTFLPSIVSADRLERGNGALETTRNVSTLVGPGLGGWLVQTLTAPVALAADAVSYLASALLLSRIRAVETPAPASERRRLRHEVAEGIRFVADHPVLRRLAMCGALNMLANGFWVVGMPLLLIKDLGLGAGLYGLLLIPFGAGALGGSLLAPRVTARFGTGPTMYGGALLVALLVLPALLTSDGWRLVFLPLAGLLFGAAGAVFGIAQISYRQRITPAHLLGRVNASMRFLMWSAMPIGSLLAGALGEWRGGYAVLAVGVVVTSLAQLPIITSRRIPRLESHPAH